ncbi:MAG TPA: site-2 protease family protein [Solirubrobacterales bacterium]|nr:site-2 protease family protein [Solirubrobacterales bacterium]
MSWFLAFLGFAVLIVLHEAGHFAAAKAVGMRVEGFSLFFGPKLWAVRRGETEYAIRAIPAGGYVKITGMNPDEELDPEVAPRAYYHQPVWKRIVVIAAGPFVNLVIAFVVLFALGATLEEPTAVAVDQIEQGSPAEGSLQTGDVLVSINGVGVTGLPVEEQDDRLVGALGDLGCGGAETDGCAATQAVPVVVEREGQRRTLELTPRYDSDVDRFRFGFAFAGANFVSADLSPAASAEWALDRMWYVTERTVSIIARIFDPEQREQISGIVGSYEVTRQSIEFDTRQAFGVLALISLSLAVINLFPFLPLDGGHIFWSLVEKVRGRPVPFSVMERASVVGFVLVLMLFAIGLSNDIDRLTGEGFDVR